MNSRTPRALLAVSSATLILGGILHALAFTRKAGAAIDGASLAPFLASELKVLWLADSTTLISVGIFFAISAIKPEVASRIAILSVAAVPAATAALLYYFLGTFYPAHMLAAASVMAIAAAFRLGIPRSSPELGA